MVETGLIPLPGRVLTAPEFQRLAEVPPEAQWFANLDSAQTRRAYQNDLRAFMAFTGIVKPEEFRAVTRSHILAWRAELETQKLAGSTIRRKLAALASLYDYANAVCGATRYVAKTKSNVEQALDLITDPSIRATLRVALDDAKRLKVVNDNLHAAFKSLQVGASLPSAAIVEPAPHLSGSGAGGELLSPRLFSALRKGIDTSRLAQQGLHVADDGSIENEHGDKLFPPAFVTAIQTVLPPA